MRFLFLNHVLIFSDAISLVCRLKYPFIYFSFNVCFQNFWFIVFLFDPELILLILLLPAAVISLCIFLYSLFESLNYYIYVILNTVESSSYFFSFYMEFVYVIPRHHIPCLMVHLFAINSLQSHRYLFLWLEFSCRVWFLEGIGFWLFLSSPFGWCYLFQRFARISSFLFLLMSWFFPD